MLLSGDYATDLWLCDPILSVVAFSPFLWMQAGPQERIHLNHDWNEFRGGWSCKRCNKWKDYWSGLDNKHYDMWIGCKWSKVYLTKLSLSYYLSVLFFSLSAWVVDLSNSKRKDAVKSIQRRLRNKSARIQFYSVRVSSM